MTVNIAKDNWWTGGDVGEVDGLGILVRQNGPHSDSSGILVNVQNQGHGFLSATEFASSIVDPVKNVLTDGIECRKGLWTIATEITLERFKRRILARSPRGSSNPKQQPDRLVAISHSISEEWPFVIFGRWRR